MDFKEQIGGHNLIASKKSSSGVGKFKPLNPATLEVLELEFAWASDKEIADASQAAEISMADPNFKDHRKRAGFLSEIANHIEMLGPELIEATCFETGLPEARIIGEKGRTVLQIREFAKFIQKGQQLGISVDEALPDRQPVPRPDIRKKNIPVGPVAVFSAGNFPLAFSTAGGDSISALAAGCPVILKGHEGHLMTNELIGTAIQKAAQISEMPDGVFSYLNGGYEVGEKLVKDPKIKSVAFTGSYLGGTALINYAQSRPEPIPVFCEMGSINPIIISAVAQSQNLEKLPQIIADSVFLGTGQFCTNPGLLLIEEGKDTTKFILQLENILNSKELSPMLSPKIFQSFSSKLRTLLNQIPQKTGHSSGYIKSITTSDFLNNELFSEEVFGPFTMAVTYKTKENLGAIISSLKGQLTTSLFVAESELGDFKSIVEKLEQKVGRIIFNAVPTGVEVCHSMHHGGPWPASSDPRFTSVGIDSIFRFLKPIAYQGFPDFALPLELQNQNLRDKK